MHTIQSNLFIGQQTDLIEGQNAVGRRVLEAVGAGELGGLPFGVGVENAELVEIAGARIDGARHAHQAHGFAWGEALFAHKELPTLDPVFCWRNAAARRRLVAPGRHNHEQSYRAG